MKLLSFISVSYVLQKTATPLGLPFLSCIRYYWIIKSYLYSLLFKDQTYIRTTLPKIVQLFFLVRVIAVSSVFSELRIMSPFSLFLHTFITQYRLSNCTIAISPVRRIEFFITNITSSSRKIGSMELPTTLSAISCTGIGTG